MGHSKSPVISRGAIRAALIALALAALARVAAAGPISDPVKIDGGKISGAATADSAVRSYKGVPFAAPPVGGLRWKPPIPAKSWEGVLACAEYSAGCTQPRSPIPLPGLNPPSMSEDCLYLNIWTPAKDTKDKLPVMVWIHGGGFAMGAAGVDMYDGEALARKGIVLVTINYRLGPFGFIAHPLLSKESKHKSSGNYGLLDQIHALKWVKNNIKAFGGDPDRVTIFGESAGGVSVAMLMVSPLSKGLFHRAIAQSGSVSLFPTRHVREAWYGTKPMELSGVELAQKLGCSGAPNELEAMRAKSDAEILAASTGPQIDAPNVFSGATFPYWVIVDGWAIPEDPAETFLAGRQHNIPFMIGANADEGSMFVAMLPLNDVADYEQMVRLSLRNGADRMLKLRPVTEPSQVKPALSELVTSGMFVAPARLMARAMEKVSAKGYYYHFTKHHATGFGSGLGAHHAAEIPYVFGNLDRMRVGDASDRALGEKMMAYWTNFAATGDPNAKDSSGAALPAWPDYDGQNDKHLEFGETVEVKAGLRKEDCDLIDEIMAEWRTNRIETPGN